MLPTMYCDDFILIRTDPTTIVIMRNETVVEVRDFATEEKCYEHWCGIAVSLSQWNT